MQTRQLLALRQEDRPKSVAPQLGCFDVRWMWTFEKVNFWGKAKNLPQRDPRSPQFQIPFRNY